MLRQFFLLTLILSSITACTTTPAVTPTVVDISKLVATVEISPTPNAEEFSATRSASSPTANPPTATVIPSETPYVGIFIGEAQQEESFVNITEPIFGPRDAEVAQQPTANAGRCLNVAIDSPYLTAWRTNPTVSQRMGCPIQAGFGLFGEVQIFETGVMYHYPELNAIWAIRPQQSGIIGIYDYLENPTSITTTTIRPQEGLIIPSGIFGSMWLGVSGLQEDMGYARTDVQETPLGLQRFDNGTFLLDTSAGQVYALVVDGTVLGPFLAAETTPGLIATPTPAGTIETEVTAEVTEETP
ncbi:MAG: hypothetical protein Phog2KO_37130 [Phototrophicaceae bacterium]